MRVLRTARNGNERATTEQGQRPSDPVFSVRDLAVEFDAPGGRVRAVNGVSFDLYAGETLAIVGETGSGKTVTSLAATRLLTADGGHVVAGSVRFEGRDLLRTPENEVRRLLGSRISLVFQDPLSALNPVLTIGSQISEVLRVHDRRLSGRAATSRAIELLRLLSVPQPELRVKQFPHQFSGGMAQRAVIAMAIANRPRVLIADEPTTAVDVTVQAQLLDVLRVAQRETGAATILITHDLGVVAEIANRVCVMYAGRVVETGSVARVFQSPLHPYTAGLIACLPRLDQSRSPLAVIPGSPPDPRMLQLGCDFQPRCGLASGRAVCLNSKPTLGLVTSGDHLAACHFGNEVSEWRRDITSPLHSSGRPATTVAASRAPVELADPAESSSALLRVDKLTKQFLVRGGVLRRNIGAVHAVDGVSFDVWPRETLALVGESGSGKTTTARTALRLLDPTSGSIVFAGQDISQVPERVLRPLRSQMQLVFQHPFGSLNPSLSVWQNVAEPLRIQKRLSHRARRERVAELFEQVGLNPQDMDRKPSEFSGGQQQRVAIARALALEPRLLVLDEPVSALDVSVRSQVLNLLQRVQADLGLGFMFVSHDLAVVRYIAHRVAVMYLGKILEIGRVPEVFENPSHPYTVALLSAVPVADPAAKRKQRIILEGDIPSPLNPPSGCRFRTRCWKAQGICADEEPQLIPRQPIASHAVACHFPGG